jgi:hypothetical protein
VSDTCQFLECRKIRTRPTPVLLNFDQDEDGGLLGPEFSGGREQSDSESLVAKLPGRIIPSVVPGTRNNNGTTQPGSER